MNDTPNKISKPDAEWRKQLSDLAYQVTRQKQQITMPNPRGE
jgi:hypothetical protein